MNFKLHTTSKILYAFLMALFSVWGWGQTTIFSENMGTSLTGTPSPGSYSGFQNSGTYTFSGTGDLRNTSNSAGYTGASGSNNVMLNAINESLIIGGFNLSSYTNLVLSFGVRKAATTENGSGLIVEYSIDGTNFTPISKDALPTATGESGWYYRSSTSSIPNTTTVIRFRSTNTVEWRIDDVKLVGTLAVGTTVPTVNSEDLNGIVGTSFTKQIVATQYPSSYNLTGTLPTGLSFDNISGVISGIPTVAGTSSVSITATNNIGTSNSAIFNFAIAKGNQLQTFNDIDAVINDPAITLPATTSAGLGINYNSSNPSTVSVSGNTLTIVGVGTATISANNIGNSNYNAFNKSFTVSVTSTPIVPWEDFEIGTKTSYVSGPVTSTAGSWTMDDALLGNTANDRKNGTKSVRIQNSGSIQTNFDIVNGVGKVKVNHALYGTDANTSWVLKASTDGGSTWNAFVSSQINTTSTTLTPVEFTLNLTGNIRLRIEKISGSGRMNIDDIYITPYTNTIWNGTVWSSGTPSATIEAIIAGTYSTTSQPAFTSKSITIKNGGVLEINGTNTINAADVTVEDGGNLVIKDSGVLNQTGAFKVLKNSASVQNKYAFWSSPVANQNLFTAYANGSSSTAPLYVMSYDPATNLYPTVANDNANFTNNAGKGYSVKVPATNASLVFGGVSQVPNNGTINVALSNAGDGYNLIGNPYPSNISLADFYTANNSAIEPTLWFWDNTTGNVTTQTGNTSVNVGFATFNAQSGTWTEAPNTQSYGSAALNSLGSFAKISQGFIVKSINGTAATFTNAMRTSAAAVTTNKNVNALEGKYWIRLNTSYGNTFTQAITYNQGASDAYDGYDSRAMGMGSDAFYSLAGTEKLVIQGRAPFQINDVVPLGNKHFENGDFTISLSHKEGLFTNGQPIYLHDKQTGTYTNLQSGNYTFAANAGDFTNRFEIVYKLNVLSTNETEKGTFEVYRDGEDFIVRNQHNIQSVEVFDSAGRKIQQISANSKSVTVKIQAKGVYILKAVSEGKPFTQKIIK
ncbi:putative Ig domain-containing protein [uncultured Chryseobacterium sp.]|uniref:putative Ig domain-containing protein n=1 Tax=uncultured Chryseobacterium sp. TaxID=259322 RepID=UPI0025D280C6|nr:putative Ig domain-containing protein [uncultured Chryseobacterium sp.]